MFYVPVLNWCHRVMLEQHELTIDLEALHFIGGMYQDWELPKEREFLFRYFRRDAARAFLHYYYCFGNFPKQFTERTGFVIRDQHWRRWRANHDLLVSIYEKSKKEMDFSLHSRLKSGRMFLNNPNRKREEFDV